jgi:hypothetical protein
MSYSTLSLEQSPPLAVPLKFMLTAPFFAALSAIVMLFMPESLNDRWNPAILAITHLLTLGFITMVMVGALQQLFPVLLGVHLHNATMVSWLVFLGMVAGILQLSAGFLLMQGLMIMSGAVVLCLSLTLLLVNFARALLRSESSIELTRGVKFALVSFLITISLGIYLAAGYVLPEVTLNRRLTALHIGWGLVGWIGLLIITISYQVVPMFQVTPKYPRWMITVTGPILFADLVGLTLLSLSGSNIGFLSSALEFIALIFLAGFAVQTLTLQYQRRRKVPDVTLDFWRFGFLCLLTCLLLLGLRRTLLVSVDIDVLLGMLMIVGFIQSLIIGMLYKIIPFLVWLHLTHAVDMSARWQLKIPNMKQIVPDRHARTQLMLHILTVILLLVSIILQAVPWIAAITFLLSNLYLAFNLIRGVSVYRKFIALAEAADRLKLKA